MAMYVCAPQPRPPRQHGRPCVVFQKDDVIRFGADDLRYDMRPTALQAYSADFTLQPDAAILQPPSVLPGLSPPRPQLNPEIFALLQRWCRNTASPAERAVSRALRLDLVDLLWHLNGTGTPEEIATLAGRLTALVDPVFALPER